jgi:hypothetical protein
MLELRPSCEHCDVALPPASTDAMICSFECTFCRACAQDLFANVCPNCGGGFTVRPVRPVRRWVGDNDLDAYPASTRHRYRPADLDAHRRLRARVGTLRPEER